MATDLACLRGIAALSLIAAIVIPAIAADSPAENDRVRLAVVAPVDEEHLAWAAASHLQRAANAESLHIDVSQATIVVSEATLPEILVMPVRSLAMQIPTFQILELPFFYDSLDVVHDRLDGVLGDLLTAEARKHGWEVVAFWDEGMHIFSGVKSFDQASKLKGREFLMTRPDPVAEKQFWYWKADPRRIDPKDRESVLSECVIAGRALTLQETVREQLYRVHLSVSLTKHRYEGWVVVAPAERWAEITDATKQKLRAALRETTVWQRNDAVKREAAALAELRRLGMRIFDVDAEEREGFRKQLPDWAGLLGDDLNEQQKRALIDLASTGAAVVSGPGSPATAEAGGNPAPGAEDR
ncbi:MAG: TRAP transporter substrate-binding protein DctP [Sedimenticolaceae bacterium]